MNNQSIEYHQDLIINFCDKFNCCFDKQSLYFRNIYVQQPNKVCIFVTELILFIGEYLGPEEIMFCKDRKNDIFIFIEKINNFEFKNKLKSYNPFLK